MHLLSSLHVAYVRRSYVDIRVTEIKIQRKYSRSCVRDLVSHRRGEHFECEFEMYGETRK